MSLFQLPEVDWVCLKESEGEIKETVRPRPEPIVGHEKKRQEKVWKIKKEKPAIPPEDILVYREAAVIDQFRSWSSCTVPMTVVANKEIYADGHERIWLLIDTKDVKDLQEARKQYHLRIAIEERYRQIKCFSDLTKFTSRAFSMVVNQVIFTMLAYNLLQLHLLGEKRKELNQKTLPHIRQSYQWRDLRITIRSFIIRTIMPCSDPLGLFSS